MPHSYYARVGAALLAAGRLLDDEDIAAAGRRNLRWTLAQQEMNGFFRHMSFDEAPPFLHTMIYVVEGLLDGRDESGDDALLAGALRFTEALRLASARDGMLRSQYNADLTPASRELCLTGLAQWAGACFRLAALGHPAYRAEGLRTLAGLKARRDAVRRSAPPWRALRQRAEMGPVHAARDPELGREILHRRAAPGVMTSVVDSGS